MKIFNVSQIQAADQYTIQHEPINSEDLMERASEAFVSWFLQNIPYQSASTIHIFCGRGNNGGDGLCIARLLSHMHFNVEIHIIYFAKKSSHDFKIKESELEGLPNISIYHHFDADSLPTLQEENILIDAILGSGLNRPIAGFTAEVIHHLNSSNCPIIAVDIPSGLYADRNSGSVIVKAQHTVSFQFPKLAFLLAQNHQFVGEWYIKDIELHPDFIQQTETPFHYLQSQDIQKILRPKTKFSHKGTSGHALILGGSYGKIGAAVLTTKATLKAGAGLVTTYVPQCGYQIMQIAVPEVMCSTDYDEYSLSEIPAITSNTPTSSPKNKYQAIAIGPGMGQNSNAQAALLQLLQTAQQPLVIDADALNIIAKNKWLKYVPKGSILTPHPKEFERLAGKFDNQFDRLEGQRKLAQKHDIVLLIKGAHTAIACPDGTVYFNSTGNPAMGTAGSGDVLTGMIAAFVAQGYDSVKAAILGVYLHGQVGDLAARAKGNILASDLIEYFRPTVQKI